MTPRTSRLTAVRLALAGLALAATASTAMAAAGGPIREIPPSLRIVASKLPNGPALDVGGNDSDGRLHGRLSGAGEYALRIVCKGEPCPHFTVSLRASNGMLKQLPDMTFTVTVGRDPVLLDGNVGIGTTAR